MKSPTPSPISDQAAGERDPGAYDIRSTLETITLLCEENGEPCDGFRFRELILKARTFLSTAPTTGSAPDAGTNADAWSDDRIRQLALEAGHRMGDVWLPFLRAYANAVLSAPPANEPAASMLTDALRYEFLRDVYTPNNGWNAIDEALARGGSDLAKAIDAAIVATPGWNVEAVERALLAASMGGDRTQIAFDKAHADCTDCDGTTCTMNCSGKENV